MDKKIMTMIVQLHNKINNTNVSVKDAMNDVFFRNTYNEMQSKLIDNWKAFPHKYRYEASSSTKSRSLEALNVPELDMQVLNYIVLNSGQTRAQIAKALSRKESTISGCVNRLVTNGRCYISGKALDVQTKRIVERVSAL